MNHLNSLIFEGEAIYKPALIEGIGTPHASFLIRNKRGEDYLHMAVVAEGSLAELAHDSIEKGAMVRVVGKLKRNLETMKVIIKADHLEIRKDGHTKIS